MKRLNKFFYAILAFAAVGMVSCSEDSTNYEPGPQEVDGCYDVYFADAETLAVKELEQGPTGEVSVDPSEATVYTYYVDRGIPEDGVLPAITVPVKVLTNTSDAFTLTDIAFAEGEDRTSFTLTLSETAEIGVPYTFSVIIDDPQYVKQYESTYSTALSVTITRVKWIDVGECAYTDDIITSWWGFNFTGEWAGVTHPTYNVKVQVRADSIDEEAFNAALAGTGSDAGLAGVYRLVNPYRVGPWADPDDTTLETDPDYMIIYATPYNRAYIPLQELGISINGGMSSVYSMVAMLLDGDRADEITEDYYGSFKNGTLTFPVKAILGCPGGSYVGANTYYANYDGAWSLTVAPALGKYELVLPEGYEDGDFEFTEVELPEEALFYSESQSATLFPILEKGKVINTTDDVDRDFVATYGTLYRLGDLYEVDYPIYFAAKADGTVTLPAQYAEQATGLVQNGYDVKMAIDAASSKFDPATGCVSLVAEFYSYQGEYGVSYGTFNEVISTTLPEFPVAPVLDLRSDFVYSEMFTDTFSSTFQAGEWDATLEQGTATNYDGASAFEAQYGKAYRIPAPYMQGYDLYFTAKDGAVSVPTGYELQNSGVKIYGQDAYISIRKGTMMPNGVTLTVAICNAEGKAIMPNACTESLITYTWAATGATGTFYSALFEEPIAGCSLEKAEEGDIYRIVNWLGTGEGKNLVFTWDKTTNKCAVVGFNKTGIDAAQFGGVGEVAVCDVQNFYAFAGRDYTWEELAAGLGEDVQPYYSDALQISETETAPGFVFHNFYALPETGPGYALGGDHFTELFILDAPLVEETWETVGTGTFTHTVDFYVYADQLPYAESGLTLQRKGQSKNYKIVGVGAGMYDIEFTYDEATGAVEVPTKSTGLKGELGFTDGSTEQVELFYMDWWGAAQLLGLQYEDGTPVTKADIYEMYPNSYDAATKTFSFYLGYYNPTYAFPWFNVNDGYPTVHTFTIDSSAATTASAQVKGVTAKQLKVNGKFGQPKQKQYKRLGTASVAVAPVSSYKKEVRSMNTVTPVPYSRIKGAKF